MEENNVILVALLEQFRKDIEPRVEGSSFFFGPCGPYFSLVNGKRAKEVRQTCKKLGFKDPLHDFYRESYEILHKKRKEILYAHIECLKKYLDGARPEPPEGFILTQKSISTYGSELWIKSCLAFYMEYLVRLEDLLDGFEMDEESKIQILSERETWQSVLAVIRKLSSSYTLKIADEYGRGIIALAKHFYIPKKLLRKEESAVAEFYNSIIKGISEE